MSDKTSQTESKELRLAKYLREFVGLRTTMVRDIAKYETVLWFGDMPQEPDCLSPAWIDDCEPDGAWLEVRKQKFAKLSPPPELILPWVNEQDLHKATENMPALKEVAFFPDEDAEVEDDEDPPLVQRHLTDHPEVTRAYEQFRPTWEAWSAEYRRRKRIQDLYAELFNLHTQVLKQGEIIEVVLGLGLLSWRRPVKDKTVVIRRHVVTAQVDLNFDPTSGVIRLECAANGAGLRIEDDMLEADYRPERSQYASVEEQLNAVVDDIWDRSLMSTALKSWAGALHPDSHWSPELNPTSERDSRPQVTFAPAIIMRKRDQRGMARVYDTLIENLSNDSEVAPAGWGGLVEDRDDRDEPENWSQPDEVKGIPNMNPGQVYFPLPANKEQRRIVDAIARRRGVLVQGPPGTGKSHTIANLVSHLLATGKRVLITAETTRALQVLKDKLPPEIQPLCVSLLGTGKEAFAELNKSVQGITTRHASWHPGAYAERIEDADRELDAARRNLAETEMELRSLREDETCPHNLSDGAYQGTASAIAERVSSERERFGWLQIPRDAVKHAPVRNDEALDWLRIWRTHDADTIIESQLHIVSSSDLPAPSVFAAAVNAEQQTQEAVDRLDEVRAHPAYFAIMARDANERITLMGKLREIETMRCELERAQKPWIFKVAEEILSGQRAMWRQLWSDSCRILESIQKNLAIAGTASLSLPDDYDRSSLRADICTVRAHLDAGGAWKRFGFWTPKAIKDCVYIREKVFVDNQRADTSDQLAIVAARLNVVDSFEQLALKWSDIGGIPEVADPHMRCAAMRELVDLLAYAVNWAERRCVACGRLMAGFTPPIPEPDWLAGDAKAWMEILDAATVEERHYQAGNHVTTSLNALNTVSNLHDRHPVIPRLIEAVQNRDVTGYSEAFAALITIEQVRTDQSFRKRIDDRLEAQVKGLVNAVVCSLDDDAWDENFRVFDQAWHWAYADNWLQKRTDFTYQQGLWKRLNDTEERIGGLISESASLRAWTYFFNRLSHKEESALKAWREAVKAIRKGTGRSAKLARLRRAARGYMEECRSAIPVWIMPRYQVAEMIDPAPERYDVVIVDEASQLGVDSLFLFYVSKKLVVVGDDQQISPYGIGIPDATIAGLQHHYLKGIRYPEMLSAQSSLYGNAKIRFGQNIVLREHFRCMPEIIQFSNDLCYASNGTPLDPLRAYPANRLQPLVTRNVTDGYRTGGRNAMNEPEADAIVAQILACLEDPRYEGKSMGVISLQGDTQAKLIERKLLQTVEPEVIEQRRLICGDSYTFQGDERHVVFLSMVAAPNERIGTLADTSAQQRFNVAASRAQDQLWLFHTADLDTLSERCMRYRLLSYMLNPERERSDEDEQHFDSQFERDVYKLVTDRGYHVRTQVCVGDPTNHRYRIDLVVEGMKGQLAVECDGEYWHGPDRYEPDMARQRDLERAGWQFVRIRGGDFYRNRAKALEPLWAELDRLGIKPGGIDESAAAPPDPAVPSSQQDNTELQRPVDENGTLPEEGYTEPKSESIDENSPNQNASPDLPKANDGVPYALRPTHSSRVLPFKAKPSAETSISSVGSPYPDPRVAKPWEVQEAMLQLIAEYGPLPCHYAYSLYIRRAGSKKVTKTVKDELDRVLKSLIVKGTVAAVDEYGNEELADRVVRMAGTPKVILRPRGDRNIEDIPPSEIAESIRRITADSRTLVSNEDELFRRVLSSFDLKRLTEKTRRILLIALEIYTSHE